LADAFNIRGKSVMIVINFESNTYKWELDLVDVSAIQFTIQIFELLFDKF